MDAAALNLTTKVLGFGRFLFLHLKPEQVDSALLRSMEALGERLENMHFVDGYPSEEAARGGRLQYLRAQPGNGGERDAADEGMSRADALIRLEGSAAEPLDAYERGMRSIIEGGGGEVHVRGGVQKPRSYTSHAMTQFAYARAQAPAPGTRHELGVVTPQSKTREWWAMDWMRRETFFLPQYDRDGRVLVKGHALVSAAGIPCVARRLYHHPQGYGLDTGYDFIGYFEFAASDAEVFREVMKGLRDREQNPEWNYVKEGPEWWGKRVGSVEELWA
jgi:hypothetical protein